MRCEMAARDSAPQSMGRISNKQASAPRRAGPGAVQRSAARGSRTWQPVRTRSARAAHVRPLAAHVRPLASCRSLSPAYRAAAAPVCSSTPAAPCAAAAAVCPPHARPPSQLANGRRPARRIWLPVGDIRMRGQRGAHARRQRGGRGRRRTPGDAPAAMILSQTRWRRSIRCDVAARPEGARRSGCWSCAGETLWGGLTTARVRPPAARRPPIAPRSTRRPPARGHHHGRPTATLAPAAIPPPSLTTTDHRIVAATPNRFAVCRLTQQVRAVAFCAVGPSSGALAPDCGFGSARFTSGACRQDVCMKQEPWGGLAARAPRSYSPPAGLSNLTSPGNVTA